MAEWRRITLLVRPQALLHAMDAIHRMEQRGLCRVEADEPAPDVCRVCTGTRKHHECCPEGGNRHGYSR